jgi:hypothetical protein
MKFQSFRFSGVLTLGVQLPADAHDEKPEGATMSVMGTEKKKGIGYFVGDGSFVVVNFSPVPRDKQHGRRQEAYSTINVPVMFA